MKTQLFLEPRVRPTAGVYFEGARLEFWADLVAGDDAIASVVLALDLSDTLADVLVLVWPGVPRDHRFASLRNLLGDLRELVR